MIITILHIVVKKDSMNFRNHLLIFQDQPRPLHHQIHHQEVITTVLKFGLIMPLKTLRTQNLINKTMIQVSLKEEKA